MKNFREKNLKTNNLVSNNLISNIKGIENEQNNFAIICTSKIIFISGKEGKIRRLIRSNENIFLNGCFKPMEGRIFAISGTNKKIDLIDTEKNFLIRKIKAHKKPIYDIAFSFDKIRIISGSDDSSVKIWDITTQKCLFSLKYHENFVRSVSYYPGNNDICGSSSLDGTIKIYDLRCYKPVVSTFNHSCPVEMFKFLPNGNNLISMGGNKLKIWCALSQKKILTINEGKILTDSEICSKDNILYSDLKNELKKYNLLKNQLFSICYFQSNVVSIASLSLGLMIGFSNGKICFKKYLKKNLNYHLFSKKKTNFFSKKSNIDFCSTFYYFPEKNKSVFGKKNFKQKLIKKKEIKKKTNHFIFQNKKSFEFLMKKKKFNNVLYGLLEVKNIQTFIAVINEFIKKGNLQIVLAKIDLESFFLIVDIFTKNFHMISSIKNVKFLATIIENYCSIINSYALISKFMKFFFFLNTKNSHEKQKLALNNYIDCGLLYI